MYFSARHNKISWSQKIGGAYIRKGADKRGNTSTFQLQYCITILHVHQHSSFIMASNRPRQTLAHLVFWQINNGKFDRIQNPYLKVPFDKVFNYARLLDWTKRLRAYSL